MARVLLVEDNEALARALGRSLEAAGYEVSSAGDGPGGLERVRTEAPDLLILDLMLPGMDGFELLETLRARGNDVPVLILTARGQEIEKIRGFNLGADDYVVKPVGVLELIGRVRAILRRTQASSRGGTSDEDEAFDLGPVHVDPARRRVLRRGEDVELSPLEFDLLHFLWSQDGAAVDRETLLREVWGYRSPVPTRTIDTHVARLRAKLEEDPAEPRWILTVPKIGYRLARPVVGEDTGSSSSPASPGGPSGIA